MHPIELFKKEHSYINRVLHLAEDRLKHIERADSDLLRFMTLIVEFLDVYSDKAHHEKEELLFSDLLYKGLTTAERDLVLELRENHLLRRNKIDELSRTAELNKKARSSWEFTGAMLVLIQSILNEYASHVQIEEDRLFPMAEKYLTQKEWQSLSALFERVDTKHDFEKFDQFLVELETVY